MPCALRFRSFSAAASRLLRSYMWRRRVISLPDRPDFSFRASSGLSRHCRDEGLQHTGSPTKTRRIFALQLRPSKIVSSLRYDLQACPVDCLTSTWTSWASCSMSCGGAGSTSRGRGIVTPSQGTGQSCPATFEMGPCSHAFSALCPIDCSMTSWSSWSSCSVSCGAGAASRTRSAAQQSMNGGQLCGLSLESSPCATQFCPVDCVATAWMSWQTCSSRCSGMTNSWVLFRLAWHAFVYAC